MGSIAACSESELDDLFGHPPENRELMELLASGRGRYIESDEQRTELAVASILSGSWPYMLDEDDDAEINRFGMLYSYTRYPAFAVHMVGPRPAHTAVRSADYEILQNCTEVLRVWEELDNSERHDWGVSLRPWEEFIEVSRAQFGEQWAHSVLALEGSGIRSTTDTARDAPHLFDYDVPLARRVRYARLRAGNPTWWGEQLRVAKAGDERLLVIAVMLSRASTRTISAHVEQLDGFVKGLSSDEFQRLYSACSRVQMFQQRGKGRESLGKDKFLFPQELSNRSVELINLRATASLRKMLYSNYLRSYSGRRGPLIDLCIEQELSGDRRSSEAWRRALAMLRRHPHGYFLRPKRRLSEMPITIAREICVEAESFDADLVEWAEARCFAATHVHPVSQVAKQEKWFESE